MCEGTGRIKERDGKVVEAISTVRDSNVLKKPLKKRQKTKRRTVVKGNKKEERKKKKIETRLSMGIKQINFKILKIKTPMYHQHI